MRCIRTCICERRYYVFGFQERFARRRGSLIGGKVAELSAAVYILCEAILDIGLCHFCCDECTFM